MNHPAAALRRWGQALALLSLVAALLACSATTTGYPTPGVTLPAGSQPTVPAIAASTPAIQPVAPQTALPAAPPAAQPTASVAPAESVPTLTTPPVQVSLRQLTSGGCCSGHFWSADGRLLVLDKPDAAASTGIWQIGLEPGSAPQLVQSRLGAFSPNLELRAFPFGRQAVVERLSDGQQWVVPSEGRPVSFSPDSQQLAWTAGNPNAPPGPDERKIWISQFDGTQARAVETIPMVGFSAWFPDGRLLVSGRLDPPESGQALWAVTPLPAGQTGQAPAVELARGERIRSPLLSPDGRWLVYMVTFSADPAQDGLWLVDTQSLQRRRIEPFGAYRWRDNSRLLIAPLDLTNPLNSLWQVDAASGVAAPLVTPDQAAFKIAAGDWTVSPDGRAAVFLSAQDQNLWLITLPED